MRKIYTHSGKAHGDDMYACALLKTFVSESEIVRIGKLPTKISTKDIVVDIGGRFDNEQFFDHHQNNDNVNGLCAATLVCRRFYPELYAHLKSFFDRLDKQDNNGLRAVGNPAEIIPLLQGEFMLVSMFEKNPDDVADMIAKNFFLNEIKFCGDVEEGKEFIKKHSKIEKINGVTVLNILQKPDIDTRAFNKSQESSINEHGVDIVYSFDVRKPKARTFFRTRIGEKNGIDLNKASPKNLVFCHKGGFILNFFPISEFEYIDIINNM